MSSIRFCCFLFIPSVVINDDSSPYHKGSLILPPLVARGGGCVALGGDKLEVMFYYFLS